MDRGITKRFKANDNKAITVAEKIYGTIILWKLIPQDNIPIISEFAAILEVKKMTVMNTNRGLNIFMK